MKTLSTSSGDGGGMEIDKRLTKVETCIEFMQTDIAEMQGDIKSINKTILKMSDSFNGLNPFLIRSLVQTNSGLSMALTRACLNPFLIRSLVQTLKAAA